ncbi:hypothetical protein ACFSTC_23930 [Nonomuraea ferruginea]
MIGVNRTRDGSIAVARGRTSVHSLQKERMTRREHHRGRLRDLPDHYLPRLPQLAGPVDLVVEGYSSDTEIANLAAYRAELRETLGLTGDTPVVLVSHHLSHLYSAFPPSPFEEAAGLVVDTQGSRVRDFTERVELPRGTPGDLLEVSSFYRCSRGRVECLAKQLWDGDWARPAGLGCFYALLTRMLWPSGGGRRGQGDGPGPVRRPGRARTAGAGRARARGVHPAGVAGHVRPGRGVPLRDQRREHVQAVGQPGRRRSARVRAGARPARGLAARADGPGGPGVRGRHGAELHGQRPS